MPEPMVLPKVEYIEMDDRCDVKSEPIEIVVKSETCDSMDQPSAAKVDFLLPSEAGIVPSLSFEEINSGNLSK